MALPEQYEGERRQGRRWTPRDPAAPLWADFWAGPQGMKNRRLKRCLLAPRTLARWLGLNLGVHQGMNGLRQCGVLFCLEQKDILPSQHPEDAPPGEVRQAHRALCKLTVSDPTAELPEPRLGGGRGVGWQLGDMGCWERRAVSAVRGSSGDPRMGRDR